jgi:hypothetical protein
VTLNVPSLDYALSNPSLQGYWGGMRHEERLRIVERRRVRCA